MHTRGVVSPGRVRTQMTADPLWGFSSRAIANRQTQKRVILLPRWTPFVHWIDDTCCLPAVLFNRVGRASIGCPRLNCLLQKRNSGNPTRESNRGAFQALWSSLTSLHPSRSCTPDQKTPARSTREPSWTNKATMTAMRSELQGTQMDQQGNCPRLSTGRPSPVDLCGWMVSGLSGQLNTAAAAHGIRDCFDIADGGDVVADVPAALRCRCCA